MKILPGKSKGLGKDKIILEVNKQLPRIAPTVSNCYTELVKYVEDYKG